MNKDIILSIIITNFNKAKYLNECLNSIIQQKLEKVEVILIDDNSNDQSKKIFVIAFFLGRWMHVAVEPFGNILFR